MEMQNNSYSGDLEGKLVFGELSSEQAAFESRLEAKESGCSLIKEMFTQKNGHFRTFGDTLASFMSKKFKLESSELEDPEKLWKFIKNAMQNDLKDAIRKSIFMDWFKDSRPSKKETLFQIAFILQLNEEETKDFIRKSFFCRPFDYRDKLDCVCYYCIRSKKAWSDVQRLLKEIDEKEKTVQKTEAYSTTLSSLWKNIRSDDELITYCAALCGRNERLVKCVQDSCAEICKSPIDKTDEEWPKKLNAIIDDEKKSIVEVKKALDKKYGDGLDTAVTNTVSVQSAVELIVGYTIGRNRNDSINAIMPNVYKRITENFPIDNNLNFNSQTPPNTDVLRKALILFTSYKYWKNNPTDHPRFSINGAKYMPLNYYRCYKTAINNILNDSGAQTLYIGDPFDALMLCSAYPSDNMEPTDKFRSIMDELREDKKGNTAAGSKKAASGTDEPVKSKNTGDAAAGSKENAGKCETDKPDAKKEIWKKMDGDGICKLNKLVGKRKGEYENNGDWVDKDENNENEYDTSFENNKKINSYWQKGHPHYKPDSETEKELIRLTIEERYSEARDELVASYYRYLILFTKTEYKRYCLKYNKNYSEDELSEFCCDAISLVTENISKYDKNKTENAELSTYITNCVKNLFKQKVTPYECFKYWLKVNIKDVYSENLLSDQTKKCSFEGFMKGHKDNIREDFYAAYSQKDENGGQIKEMRDFFNKYKLNENYVGSALQSIAIRLSVQAPGSLNAPLDDSSDENPILEDTLEDRSSDTAGIAETNETTRNVRLSIKSALEKLNDTDKALICHEYGLDGYFRCTSFEELNKQMNGNFTTEDVRMAEYRFIRYMKMNLGKYGDK